MLMEISATVGPINIQHQSRPRGRSNQLIRTIQTICTLKTPLAPSQIKLKCQWTTLPLLFAVVHHWTFALASAAPVASRASAMDPHPHPLCMYVCVFVCVCLCVCVVSISSENSQHEFNFDFYLAFIRFLNVERFNWIARDPDSISGWRPPAPPLPTALFTHLAVIMQSGAQRWAMCG